MVWQRHEAHHPSEGTIEKWPSRADFRTWPLSRPGGLGPITFPLIVADWKISQGAAKLEVSEPVIREYHYLDGKTLDIHGELDAELLDPPLPPEVHWRDTFAAELAAAPALAADLATGKQGDGIERVLERAQLTSGERAVIRAWLSNRGDLAKVAEDLQERPQTVNLIFGNALYRLRYLGQNATHGSNHEKRGNVGGSEHRDAGREGVGHVSPPPSSRRGAQRRLEPSPRSRTGHVRGLRSQTA